MTYWPNITELTATLALQPDTCHVDAAVSLACWFTIVITKADEVYLDALGR